MDCSSETRQVGEKETMKSRARGSCIRKGIYSRDAPHSPVENYVLQVSTLTRDNWKLRGNHVGKSRMSVGNGWVLEAQC